MSKMIHHFINGRSVEGTAERSSDIYNPATGEITGRVSFASETEVNAAVDAASVALKSWSAVTPLRRSRILFKFKALLEEHADELVRLITDEHGKILSDARGELTRGIEVVEFACGIPHLLKGEFSENVGTGVDSYSMRQPVGVCVGITPFNFPAMVPMWMFPVAIACGNTFVLKPSERDPSCMMRVCELFHEAGLPEGVFNVVNGDKVAVNVLLNHPSVAAVSFVGSTPVAESIYQTAMKNGKRVQALGGAKNHAVVMPDADLDMAINGLMGAAYGSAGERCMAIAVAVAVGDQVADALIEGLKAKIESLIVGPGTQDKVDMGPLVTKQHFEKVSQYVEIGVSEGAKLVADGRGLKVDGHENGFFMGPCLFDNVTPEMRIYQEEIFGPVLCVVRVNDFDAALKLINSHEFANGTALFTQSGGVARKFASEVEVGMIGINVPIPVPMAFYSFGGWRRSLFGDMHVHGKEGINFYTRMKAVTSRWPARVSDAEFVMPTL